MVEQKKTLDELFPGWEPILIEDEAGLDFNKPIKGKYVARIAKINRYSGTQKDGETHYDFLSLSLQAVEDIEGDPSANRYLSKTYSFIDGKYSTAEEDLKKLLNDLFTAGLLADLDLSSGSMEAILEVADALIDKTVNITCWATKGGKQSVKIVNQHKLKAVEVAGEEWS